MHNAASHRSPLIGYCRMILLRRCQQRLGALSQISDNRWSDAFKRTFATQVPPPDLSRSGTADLCDIYHPENVDVIHDSQLKIVDPIFRSSSLPDHFSIRLRPQRLRRQCQMPRHHLHSQVLREQSTSSQGPASAARRVGDHDPLHRASGSRGRRQRSCSGRRRRGIHALCSSGR